MSGSGKKPGGSHHAAEAAADIGIHAVAHRVGGHTGGLIASLFHVGTAEAPECSPEERSRRRAAAEKFKQSAEYKASQSSSHG